MPRKSNSGPCVRLAVSVLEDRTTPSAGGVPVATGPYAVGVADGRTGDVVVYNADRTVAYTVTAPYGADFTGGVRVALSDVTGDGTVDLITAPGKGTEGLVKVFDGVTHAEVASFDAYGADFTGGVSIAASDLTGDGKAEIITAANQGEGPHVVVFDGSSVSGTAAPTALADFVAFESTSTASKVRLSVADVTGDGVADVKVGAAPRGARAVFDGASLAQGQEVELLDTVVGIGGCGPGAPATLTASPALFGGPHGPGGGKGGFAGHGGPGRSGGTTITVADADAVAAAVVGTYSGSASGQLSTLSTTGDKPTTTTETATVSVDITSATPVTSDSSSTSTTQPLRALTLTGTITVTVGTADPVIIPFTGTLRLSGGTADAPTGTVVLSTDRSSTGVTTATGFVLGAKLSDGALTVGGLVVSDHSNPPGGFVFQSPESRDAATITLTRA